MILFYVLAIVLIASAIFTVTQKSPVYSVVGLLANFIALAALYFTLNAEFLGVVQIVVYSGAILMLFVFVIALLSSGIGPFSEGPNRLPRMKVPAIVIALVAFGFLIFGIVRQPFGTLPAHVPTSTLGLVGTADVFGSVADFGKALFTVQLLPFEVTAFILMVAVIGVVMLAGDAAPQATIGRHRPQKKSAQREPIVKSGTALSVDVSSYITLSAVMFFIGVAGVVLRRNPLIVLMAIELMFNAANLALVAFSRAWVNNAGHIFVFLVVTVAAAEAAIGLAIVVAVFRRAKNVDLDEVARMRG